MRDRAREREREKAVVRDGMLNNDGSPSGTSILSWAFFHQVTLANWIDWNSKLIYLIGMVFTVKQILYGTHALQIE